MTICLNPAQAAITVVVVTSGHLIDTTGSNGISKLATAQYAIGIGTDLTVGFVLRKCAHSTDAVCTDLGYEHRAKSVALEPNRFVANVKPALMRQVVDIATRQ